MAEKKNILVICESPNKTETIKHILGPGYKVMASVGHITEIKDGGSYWNTGIDPSHNFSINYQITTNKEKPALDKHKKVAELRAAVAEADRVLLATDPDREGEAIAWHLKEQLKIPEKKYDRITFHEVTKPAVLKALESPRKIDENLVWAAKARGAGDKMLGYRVTPITWEHMNNKGVSAGRCKSPTLMLVVQREEEIQNFKVEKYYDLYLHFEKNKTAFKAKYQGTDKKEIKHLADLEACKKIVSECTDDFIVRSIDKKEQKDNPKPPFTTSTFQQEANKLYGMSIDKAMSCAQKLFEGISVKGEHVGLITYIRTDDSSMSPEFAANLATFVKTNYGKDYYAPVKKGAKTEGSQEAHECLRVVNLNMRPDDLAKIIPDKDLIKIYRLIWLRTVQSSMAPAIISDTEYDIYNNDHKFVMHSREVIFDGYRKVFTDEDDEISSDEIIKETFENGEKLKKTSLKEEEKQTTPPKRYTEGTLTKELDKRGIGRPSTFATIVKSLLNSSEKFPGFCKIENKYIVPTEVGIATAHFLEKSFPDLLNLTYTSEMEKQLDLIATGKLDYITFMTDFYNILEASAAKIEIKAPTCPICGGKLVKRKGKYGYFWGCSNWKPKNEGCNYIKPVRN